MFQLFCQVSIIKTIPFSTRYQDGVDELTRPPSTRENCFHAATPPTDPASLATFNACYQDYSCEQLVVLVHGPLY